jgi:hypothetical protein
MRRRGLQSLHAHTHTHHTHTRVYTSSFSTERKQKKNRGYTDAAGKPKSLVRKCSELNSIDVSNRNDKLYVELTGTDDRSIYRSLLYISSIDMYNNDVGKKSQRQAVCFSLFYPLSIY